MLRSVGCVLQGVPGRGCGAAGLLCGERLLSSQKGLFPWLLCSSLSVTSSR